MTKSLAILLWQATPANPAACATPFVHATAAAALEAKVEIHFAGEAVLLLVAGVAAALRPWVDDSRSLYDLMLAAHEQGVGFYACAMARAQYVRPELDLIDEYDGAAGATSYIQHALDPAWTTLVF